MQFVAENRLFFRRYFSIGRAIRLPICAGGSKGHQTKLHHGQRQTINDTLTILGYVQAVQNDLPDQVERLHQATPTPIESTLSGDDWKQIPVLLPLTEHFRFQVPAT